MRIVTLNLGLLHKPSHSFAIMMKIIYNHILKFTNKQIIHFVYKMNMLLTKLYTYSVCNKNTFKFKSVPQTFLLQSVSMFYSISNMEWNGLEPLSLSAVEKYTLLTEWLFINL